MHFLFNEKWVCERGRGDPNGLKQVIAIAEEEVELLLQTPVFRIDALCTKRSNHIVSLVLAPCTCQTKTTSIATFSHYNIYMVLLQQYAVYVSILLHKIQMASNEKAEEERKKEEERKQRDETMATSQANTLPNCSTNAGFSVTVSEGTCARTRATPIANKDDTNRSIDHAYE